MDASVSDIASLDLAEIGQRVRRMLSASGIDGKEFAIRIGVPYPTMRAYLTGGRAPSAEFLVGCFRAFGYMPGWVLTGSGPMTQEAVRSPEPPEVAFDRDYLVVPQYSVKAGAGGGVVNEPESEYRVGGVCVSRAWLVRRRLSPTRLCAVQVRGRSMEPVLHDGDQVLVDQGDTTPRSGFVYVLRQGDELLVKYIEQLPGGKLRVSSANSAFQPYDVSLDEAHDVEVVGRVVASMHDW